MLGQGRGALRHPLGEHRGGVQQLRGHADPLGTLAGKDEGNLPVAAGDTLDDMVGRFAAGQRGKTGSQAGTVRRQHDGTVLEPRPSRGQ